MDHGVKSGLKKQLRGVGVVRSLQQALAVAAAVALVVSVAFEKEPYPTSVLVPAVVVGLLVGLAVCLAVGPLRGLGLAVLASVAPLAVPVYLDLGVVLESAGPLRELGIGLGMGLGLGVGSELGLGFGWGLVMAIGPALGLAVAMAGRDVPQWVSEWEGDPGEEIDVVPFALALVLAVPLSEGLHVDAFFVLLALGAVLYMMGSIVAVALAVIVAVEAWRLEKSLPIKGGS